MPRIMPLAVVLALSVGARGAEPEPKPDFEAITVEGEDVAAVTTQKQPWGSRVRVRLVARGNGEVIRIGTARTLDAGVSGMAIVKLPTVKSTFTEAVNADSFVAIAAGPKDSPVKLEKIEVDAATAGSSKLSFEGGMIIQVELVAPEPRRAGARRNHR